MSSVHKWGWGRNQTLPLLGGRSNPTLASLPDPVRRSRGLKSREWTPGIGQAGPSAAPAVLTLVWGKHSLGLCQ